MLQCELDSELKKIEDELKETQRTQKPYFNNGTLKYIILTAKACAYSDYPYAKFVSVLEKKLGEQNA